MDLECSRCLKCLCRVRVLLWKNWILVHIQKHKNQNQAMQLNPKSYLFFSTFKFDRTTYNIYGNKNKSNNQSIVRGTLKKRYKSHRNVNLQHNISYTNYPHMPFYISHHHHFPNLKLPTTNILDDTLNLWPKKIDILLKFIGLFGYSKIWFTYSKIYDAQLDIIYWPEKKKLHILWQLGHVKFHSYPIQISSNIFSPTKQRITPKREIKQKQTNNPKHRIYL